MGRDPAQLVQEAQQQRETALANHRAWEERTGFKLVLALTRNVAVLSQLTTAQTRAVGTAIETLTLYLKRTTNSLALTPTRPSRFELMILWEKDSWTKFRQVMEGLYSRRQLGESWQSAEEFNSYDHYIIPHMYETPESIRSRPPTCGSVFLAARRQINIATKRRSPFWLSEGFAAYGDYIVHKTNRWYTVDDPSRTPTPGDWMQEARRLSRDGKLRPWSGLLKRELQDFMPAYYSQAMTIVAFLLESESHMFLEFVRRLKGGQQQQTALEEAYHLSIDELEQRGKRWLAGRR